jgi:hypothetical protein
MCNGEINLSRFNMDTVFTANYFFIVRRLSLSDNFKIKSAQSFRCALKNRIYIYKYLYLYCVSKKLGELTGEWGCTALPQLSCRVRERGLPSCGLGPLSTTVSCFVTIRASAAVVPTFLVCNGPIVIDSRGPFHTGHKY